MKKAIFQFIDKNFGSDPNAEELRRLAWWWGYRAGFQDREDGKPMLPYARLLYYPERQDDFDTPGVPIEHDAVVRPAVMDAVDRREAELEEKRRSS